MTTTLSALKWRPTNAPEASSRTDDIWFIDPDTGWAVNSNGQILKTADGGVTWDEQKLLPGTYLRCCGFANSQVGWVGTLTQNNRLYHTTDGGANWNVVGNIPGQPTAICGLSVINESVVYGSGTNYPNRPTGLIKTTDGGASWAAINMAQHANILVDNYFIDELHGWVVGGKSDSPNPTRGNVKAVVLYTDDGGQTWDNRAVGTQGLPLGEWGWKIQFLNESIGFVALENFTDGAILTTTDGGQTWTRKKVNDPQGNANLEGIGFVDADHGWVGGWGDATFQGGFSSETFNGGDNWQNANEIGRFINRFRFFGNPVTVGYASGKTVYKYSSEPVPAPATAIAPVPMLKTNEPEEFSGEVSIDYTVPAGSQHVELEIWDRFGESVHKLVEEDKPQDGTKTVVWNICDDDGKTCGSGSYIYRLTIDNHAESRIIWLK